MDDLQLSGKRVRLFLKVTGYRYTGSVLAETERFLTLQEERDSSTRIFNKEEISTIEVLPDAKAPE
jgi:hypothetical protein